MKRHHTIRTTLLAIFLVSAVCLPALGQRAKDYTSRATLESIDFEAKTITFLDRGGESVQALLHPKGPRMVFIHTIAFDELEEGAAVEVILTKGIDHPEAQVHRIKQQSPDYRNRSFSKGRAVVGTLIGVNETMEVDVNGETYSLALPANRSSIKCFKETTAVEEDYKPGISMVVKGRNAKKGIVLGQLRIMADDGSGEDDEEMDEEG